MPAAIMSLIMRPCNGASFEWAFGDECLYHGLKMLAAGFGHYPPT